MKQNQFDAYTMLANGIVIQAVKDYREALFRLRRKSTNAMALAEKEECERFFYSGYFAILTKLDPDYLIERIQREVCK